MSTGGGIGPAWRKDGKELFFYSRDGQVMSVDVNAATSFEASAPHALFVFRAGNGITFVSPFAAAADGKRFLLNTIVYESGRALDAGDQLAGAAQALSDHREIRESILETRIYLPDLPDLLVILSAAEPIATLW